MKPLSISKDRYFVFFIFMAVAILKSGCYTIVNKDGRNPYRLELIATMDEYSAQIKASSEWSLIKFLHCGH